MKLLTRHRGRMDYAEALMAMQRLTDTRDAATSDELWLLEHPPVFTLGLNADPAHILAAGDVPVLRTDRGGQVTYHGPGQLVAYVLLDLGRRHLGVRAMVMLLERATIGTLARYGIAATGNPHAPGVYVAGAKIASLGLRIRRGCSYHGLAFNVAMDLAPFARINPCGFEGLRVTQLADLGGPSDLAEVATVLESELRALLGE